jgi:hypothetical protein
MRPFWLLTPQKDYFRETSGRELETIVRYSRRIDRLYAGESFLDCYLVKRLKVKRVP